MSEIVFKGKEYVYNHHLTVPYRPLLVDAAKGIGPADLGSNLVIHGDNLHALKSLPCRAPVLLAHAEVTKTIFFNGSKI